MPVTLLLTSLFVLSQSAIFVRLANAPAPAIGFWRMIIALPVLAGFLFWHKRWKDFRSFRRRDWVGVSFCGFLLFAHFFTWFLSVQMTSVANSMILFSANPLFTAIGAWIFFGERMVWRHCVALLLCFVGVYFMIHESLSLSREHFDGDLWGLACAVLFSAYVLMSKGLRQRVHNLPFAFSTYSVVAGCFFASMLVMGVPFFGYSLHTWVGFSGLAFGSTLLGHSLFTYCLQFFNVNLMSISTLAEPLLMALSAYVFFGEPLSHGAIIGFPFVVGGIAVLYFPYLSSVLKSIVRPAK
jgi:drug/metabolite transporter (DMT)-like permease